MAEHERVQQPESLKLHDYHDDVSRAAPQGRLDTLSIHDLGEQVVGSTHELTIQAPKNLDYDKPAYARAEVEGFPGLSTHWEGLLRPNLRGKPVTVTFAPTRVGEFKGKIVFYVRWSDDSVQMHSIVVTGRARALDDVPADHKVAPKPRLKIEDDQLTDAEKRAPIVRGELGPEVIVLGQFHHMAEAQQRGVQTVWEESKKFTVAPETESIWWELAELALIMGTAGVAAAAGKFIAQHLGKVAHTVLGPAGKEVEHAVEHESLAVEGVATAIEDGIKHNAENSIQGIKKGTPAATSSKDDEIEFFSVQQDVLATAESESARTLVNLMSRLGARRPDIAGDVMDGMARGFGDAVEHAKREQMTATATQWLAYKARLKLGSEKAGEGEDARTVTDMKELRGKGDTKLDISELASGVLEIAVSRHPDGAIAVNGARVMDVSSLIVQRLLPLDLRHAGVPIRLVINGMAVITVDESGRARVGGAAPLDLFSGDGDSEIQQMREAERIVGVVVARPLEAWGIREIRTNDAHK